MQIGNAKIVRSSQRDEIGETLLPIAGAAQEEEYGDS